MIIYLYLPRALTLTKHMDSEEGGGTLKNDITLNYSLSYLKMPDEKIDSDQIINHRIMQ